MTRSFDGQSFEGLRDRGTGRSYEDFEFRRCSFQGCFTVASKPKHRVTFRHVRMIDCDERGCTIRAAILDECTVSGLRTEGLFQTWGAVYRHVALTGRIGRVMLSGSLGVSEEAVKQQKAFDDANAAFYAGIDWALDISQAEFEECDLRGVPARLVRRDPETQVMVTRSRALKGEWQHLDLSRTHWATALELFLRRGLSEVVFVAPKRGRDFNELVAGLRLLREAGVAEPD